MLGQMKKKGFTLIELIIVIAIIAVIVSVVFVALDPVKRLNASRNTRRRADVTAIVSAISLHLVGAGNIEKIDSDPGTWQMLGSGNECGILNCAAGSDGILSSQAASFNGLGHLRIGTIPFPFQPTSTFTVAAWANVQVGANPLVSLHDDNDDGIDLMLMPNQAVRLVLRTSSAELIAQGDATTSDGTFHHIAATYDGTISDSEDRIKLYVDGQEIATTTTLNGILGTFGTTGAFAFGTGDNPLIYLDGILDDVRLYDNVLSSDSIRGLAIGKDLREGILGYWNFENSGDPWTDSIAGVTLIPSGTVEQIEDTPSVLNGQGTLFILSECIDLEDELVGNGRLGRIPFDPAADVEEMKTYYVVNRNGGTHTARACLAESEGIAGQGTGPLIEASR